MSDPLVTIGLPFYNPGEGLADAIASVVAQRFDDWHLVIVDDGSTTGAAPSLARWKGHQAFTIIRGSSNLGLSARLNQIAQVATGKYLARMDADDLMHPQRIQRQVEALESQPKIDVLGTEVYILDQAGAPVGRTHSRDPNTTVARLRRNPLVHSSVMATTRWFRAHEYDEGWRRAQDFELWVRAAPTSRYSVLDSPLHFYRRPQLDWRFPAAVAAHLDLVRVHGEAQLGALGKRALIAALHLKRMAYRAMRMAGRKDPLKRYETLTPDETADAEAALRSIREAAAR